MSQVRQAGHLTKRYGLSKCSACGELLVKARSEEILPEERQELSRLGIALLAAEYDGQTLCSRERERFGICFHR